MGWSGCFAAVLESEPRQESLVRGDGEGTATLEIDTSGVARAKDLVGMRMPIWYDAMQAPAEAAARVARERGARPGAWLQRRGSAPVEHQADAARCSVAPVCGRCRTAVVSH